MSATGANTPANHFGGSFGPNEWLVDEMYERYLVDPNSVDKAWWEFFSDYSPASANSAALPTLSDAPKGGTPPLPKAASSQSDLPASFDIPKTATKVSAPAPQVQTETPKPMTNTPATPNPTPADPVVKPIPTLVTPGASSLEPIRGVSARVVQSMEASLAVPTATSVRAVPAKLLIDNRTVINNHLKRGRGGKVSFTHLIGYAMIKAMRQLSLIHISEPTRPY